MVEFIRIHILATEKMGQIDLYWQVVIGCASYVK